MKLAVTAQGTELSSPVETRFGRAPYFVLVDTETGQFTAYDNSQNVNAPQGAGIQSAQAIANLGADVLLTGTVGTKALATLQAAEIPVYLGVAGTVTQTVNAFRAGRLTLAKQASAAGHVI
jgi:predicted Fe-Mo cluster-binding NifX family protein